MLLILNCDFVSINSSSTTLMYKILFMFYFEWWLTFKFIQLISRPCSWRLLHILHSKWHRWHFTIIRSSSTIISRDFFYEFALNFKCQPSILEDIILSGRWFLSFSAFCWNSRLSFKYFLGIFFCCLRQTDSALDYISRSYSYQLERVNLHAGFLNILSGFFVIFLYYFFSLRS